MVELEGKSSEAVIKCKKIVPEFMGTIKAVFEG
jgi:hypothetical protein